MGVASKPGVLSPGELSWLLVGQATGADRGTVAAKGLVEEAQALGIPLGSASSALMFISGGAGLTISDAAAAGSCLAESIHPDAELLAAMLLDTSEVDVLRLWVACGTSDSGPLARAGIVDGAKRAEEAVPVTTERINYRKLRVFLASPGDLGEERVAVAGVVSELNELNADRWGMRLELVRWEDCVIPAMGRPQAVVNEQTDLENVDVFLGVLWSRLGTPTGIADSGTVEEFERAFTRWRECGRPWIAMYFCSRPVFPANPALAAQLFKVVEFRERVATIGIHWQYQTVREFEGLVRRHLFGIAERIHEAS